MEQIIVALITGGITLAGVLLSNQRTQAVTETKLEELTREVREHNNFARRMPVVEEQIKVINHRISDLEESQKGAVKKQPKERWRVSSERLAICLGQKRQSVENF